MALSKRRRERQIEALDRKDPKECWSRHNTSRRSCVRSLESAVRGAYLASARFCRLCEWRLRPRPASHPGIFAHLSRVYVAAGRLEEAEQAAARDRMQVREQTAHPDKDMSPLGVMGRDCFLKQSPGRGPRGPWLGCGGRRRHQDRGRGSTGRGESPRRIFRGGPAHWRGCCGPERGRG